jgi:hypothetical protein
MDASAFRFIGFVSSRDRDLCELQLVGLTNRANRPAF